MGITAKDLAQKLGLSPAAVSMALNGKAGVSDKTRTQVKEAAERYGFDFSKLNDKRHNTGHIYFILYKRQGAVVGDTPFFSQLSEGIENGCKNAGYKLQICYLYKGDDVENQLAEIVCAGCAGILLLGTELTREDFMPFSKLTLPMVLVDAYFDTLKHDCVLINNVQGAYLATDFLITQTKKQPGYLHSSYMIGNFEERADGFYKAVRQHGMSTSKSIVHKLTPSVEGAYADMTALIDAKEELAPCYFADNDLIAIGAMRAMRAKGIKIPGDIKVIGFDNIPMADYFEPPLTTINVPKQYMGEMAVWRLIEILHKKIHVPIKIEIGTRLIIRRSV